VLPYVICLPGRDNRAHEQSASSAEEFVMEVSTAIVGFAAGRNFAILGHSLGGNLAHLAATNISEHFNVIPIVTFVACSAPPCSFGDGTVPAMVAQRLVENGVAIDDDADLHASTVVLEKQIWGDGYDSPLVFIGGTEDDIVCTSDFKKWEEVAPGRPGKCDSKGAYDASRRAKTYLIPEGDHHSPSDARGSFSLKNKVLFKQFWKLVSAELKEAYSTALFPLDNLSSKIKQ